MLIYIATSIIILSLACFILMCFFFFNLAFKRKPPLNKKNAPRIEAESDNTHQTYFEDSVTWFKAQKQTTLEIVSNDGLNLKASYIECPNSEKLALVIHGWTSNRYEMGGLAKLYYEMGYSILAPDQRGHGESDGKYYGFGLYESDDMLLWLKKAIDKFHPKQILITGHSMGGATTMMLSQKVLPDEVKCMIEDCGYSSLNEQMACAAKNIMPKWLHFIIPCVLCTASLISRVLQGYGFPQVDCASAVRACTRPMLFIHGDKDELVPCFMVNTCFDACTSQKELLIVKNAEHAKSIAENRALYKKTVQDFVNKYIN